MGAMNLQLGTWGRRNAPAMRVRWYDRFLSIGMNPCSERKRGAASAKAHAQHLPPGVIETSPHKNSANRGNVCVVSKRDGHSEMNKSAGRIVKERRMKSIRTRPEEEAFHDAESAVCTNPRVGSSLLLYATGDLSNQEEAKFEEHLHRCLKCSLDLPAMRMMARSLKEVCLQEAGDAR